MNQTLNSKQDQANFKKYCLSIGVNSDQTAAILKFLTRPLELQHPDDSLHKINAKVKPKTFANKTDRIQWLRKPLDDGESEEACV